MMAMRGGFIFRQAQLVVVALVLGGLILLPEASPPRRDAAGEVKSAATTTPPSSPSASPAPSAKRSPKPKQPAVEPGAVSVGGRALDDWQLYVEPGSEAAEQAVLWRASRPADAARMDRLAAQPQAKWLGDWNPDPYQEAREYVEGAAAAGKLPVLTLYNLPGRDCGSYSSGGAKSPAVYAAWVGRVAQAIGQRPVLVVLEPDALAELECFDAAQQRSVYGVLAGAVNTLKQDAQARIYLDAGNSLWQTPATMAQRLNAGGIGRADGFALNVSNFLTTAESAAYGAKISALVGGKHFVIDSSRNGRGYAGDWCNPAGRALGQTPTVRTGNALADAYVWVKLPGESDGTCNGGPKAGEWWPEYALGLAVAAGW
jgi:endoglucanase